MFDNLDSFTYNLYDYLLQCGATCEVIRNNSSAEDWENLQFDAAVLSPGPGRPLNSGNLLKFINTFFEKIPIYGICLGHQAIGISRGGILKHGIKPMHGKVSKIKHVGHLQYKNLPINIEVCRYHSLVLDSTHLSEFEITASTAEGEVMSIAHKKFPVWGVQYHPEAILTEHGLQLIKNWMDYSTNQECPL